VRTARGGAVTRILCEIKTVHRRLSGAPKRCAR